MPVLDLSYVIVHDSRAYKFDAQTILFSCKVMKSLGVSSATQFKAGLFIFTIFLHFLEVDSLQSIDLLQA